MLTLENILLCIRFFLGWGKCNWFIRLRTKKQDVVQGSTIPLYTQGAWFTAYLCIAIGHQSDRHDFIQQDPGGEEHVTEKKSAAGTQTLIVKSDLDWICCLVGPGEVGFKALLQNLHKGETMGRLSFMWALSLRLSARTGHFPFGGNKEISWSVVTFL